MHCGWLVLACCLQVRLLGPYVSLFKAHPSGYYQWPTVGVCDVLQVLISIQSMILGTAHPYFNEPGYSSSEGTKQ